MTALPGLAPDRICTLMHRAVGWTGLDLHGMTVLTEAATGAYGVTAPIAALANAQQVIAIARSSAHGSAQEAADWTQLLARSCGVEERVRIVDALPAECNGIDIVTNSGHVRPINSDLIARLSSRGVIALMFEAWEFRDEDIDLSACEALGIPIVGVNERHPLVDVFSYLGPLCVKLLFDAGIPVYADRIALLCDNPFGTYIVAALEGLGASVSAFDNAGALEPDRWDAVIVALKPGQTVRVDAADIETIARAAPRALLAQFWGDVDRSAAAEAQVRLWPPEPPRHGHMAVLLSALGAEPIVRLQTGGLRAAEWVCRGGAVTPSGLAQLVERPGTGRERPADVFTKPIRHADGTPFRS
jgi:hypothetical protein